MILYGASGHAKVIIDCLQSQGIEITALYDDNSEIKTLLDFDVEHDLHKILALNKPIIIAIGDNHIRKSIYEKLFSSNSEHPTSYVLLPTSISHPSSIISSETKIEEGTVVFHNAVIQTGTLIGRHAIINTSASIDHDCKLGDFVHIAPNATLCGGITVGEGSLIGAGSVVNPNVKIGKWCVIGAGTVVTRDIPDNTMVVGNPGRVVKRVNG